MPAAKDKELRTRAVQAYISLKARDPSVSYGVIADKFGISRASLNRWLRLHRESGSLEPRVRPGNRVRKLTDEQGQQIAGWLLSKPTLRLWELQQRIEAEFGLTVSDTTVRRELRRQGIRKRRLVRQPREAGADDEPDRERRYQARHRRRRSRRGLRVSYPSDLTDPEWEVLEPVWRQHLRGRPRVELRSLIDAVRYIAATGCPWRFLPGEYPPPGTVRRWFDRWSREGVLRRVNAELRRRIRVSAGREPSPSLLIVDSQSIKTNEGGERRGYDGGKKVAGRKRHIAVDTLGLVWRLEIQPANMADRDGIETLIEDEIGQRLPRLKKLMGDAGYQGRAERRTQKRTGIVLEIARRRGDSLGREWAREDGPPPTVKGGFQVVPKRWIVERTLAWCTRRRRLARDYERSVEAASTWFDIACQVSMTARCVA